VPVYNVTDTGPDHQKVFRAVVEIGGRALGDGEGRSKKAAEQLAAEVAWRAISAEVRSEDSSERTGPSPHASASSPEQASAPGPGSAR
jgi:ribonuclease III